MELGPPRQRSVLGALLVQPGAPVSLDSLVDRVWDDVPPASARNVIYSYLTRVRQTIAVLRKLDNGCTDMVLERTAAGYSLHIADEFVDMRRFYDLVRTARAPEQPDYQRSLLLEQALSLWQGEALSGMNSGWAEGVRSTAESIRIDATIEWADALLRIGAPERVISPLRARIATASLVESLWERLITGLYHTGRSMEALTEYQRARDLFGRELGADPSAQLQQLYAGILANEDIAPAPRRAHRPAVVGSVGAASQTLGADLRGSTVDGPADAVRPEPLIPQTLPRDRSDFLGRESESAEILSVLRDSKVAARACVIIGHEGMGKATLAVHVAHQLGDDFPDGRLYARMRDQNGNRIDPRAMLRRLVASLGERSLPADAGLDCLVDAYRTRLSNRRILVVLTDVADDEQLEPLIPASADTGLLVTTRSPLTALAGSPVIVMRPFDEREAHEFMRGAIGGARVDAEPIAVRNLIAICGRRPLALRAAAMQL
ncbi:winged helix-turn-helix domain-containing protein, partial [Nocardia sp. BSTN01]|uniref:AfsR/SARP family transcriptional regulator n=1 Tax=Nocardia sp. BSTN01 TaxID=2783665 RepID=UPI00188DD897